MKPLEQFYTEAPDWHQKIGDIHALLERVKISEEQSGDALHLRKLNRIMSIHASTAIEGNCLTLGQVADVINGKPVRGPEKDIKEVQNAWQAYNEMANYAPWLVGDLLKAHANLTETLIGESGRFRSVGVAVGVPALTFGKCRKKTRHFAKPWMLDSPDQLPDYLERSMKG